MSENSLPFHMHTTSRVFSGTQHGIWAVFSQYSAFIASQALELTWPVLFAPGNELHRFQSPSSYRKPCINDSAKAHITSCIQWDPCAFSLLNSFFSGYCWQPVHFLIISSFNLHLVYMRGDNISNPTFSGRALTWRD